MALQLLQQRIGDLARRLGYSGQIPNLHYISWQEADGLLSEGKWAPLNTPEGQDYLLRLCEVIQPDVIFLDNVQSLIAGDMKDEVPWNDTTPLVLALTARRIGQVWCDHMGHEQTRQYGSARKAWQFDTVALMLPLDNPTPGELGFTLSFDHPGKARRRTPDNWQEYAPRVIRLREDQWTAGTEDGSGEPAATIAASRNAGRRGRPKQLDTYASKARDILADLLCTEGQKGPPRCRPPYRQSRANRLERLSSTGRWRRVAPRSRAP
jgi:hypothetical protein